MSHMRLNSAMKLYYSGQNSAMKLIYYNKLCHTSEINLLLKLKGTILFQRKLQEKTAKTSLFGGI